MFCLWLMKDLPGTTWLRFVIWLVVGWSIYFAYSIRHSRLRQGEEPADAPVAGSDDR